MPWAAASSGCSEPARAPRLLLPAWPRRLCSLQEETAVCARRRRQRDSDAQLRLCGNKNPPLPHGPEENQNKRS